jgi:hypothetical protein
VDSRLHILGIRHHGPGSAASVLKALDALHPKIVLIEGPPEATEILPLAAAAGMKPPVAILTYPTSEPKHARFHPFAEFSPEWQAMLWATRHGTLARFIDEPLTLAEGAADEAAAAEDEAPSDPVRRDPLTHLAVAAGHSDGEAWWNALIEQRVHAPDVFAVIETAMAALRSAVATESPPKPDAAREERREAHMRLAIRGALEDTDGAVAVVCGAWHAPALREQVALGKDRAAIKGTRAANATACWVPWTDTRLAAASGYGAGVISPAWYRHLWTHFEQDSVATIALWQARAARLLRSEGLPASTSSVIEATRLATTLAALRGQPMPGLSEMRDATLAALCHGDPVPLRVIELKLVIGSTVGAVDASAPQPPLLADLQKQQKKLRLKPDALEQDVALDLRSDAGLAKSVLLHRLSLLGVPWGRLVDASAGRGTFREVWRLLWAPELAVALAEASVHGPTVEQAAETAALARAADETDCGALAELVRHCLLADLPKAARANIARLQAVAVSAGNVLALARAVAPLVDVLRYGTARELPAAELRALVLALLAEVCAGVRYACHGLDDAAAAQGRADVAGIDGAVRLLEDAASDEQWRRALESLPDDDQVAPLLRGFAVRLLYGRGAYDAERTAASLGRALSSAVPVHQAGAWFEGFIDGAGEVLLADDALFATVDEWLARQSEETFVELLPLLRRSFAGFDASTRRSLLERVRQSGRATAALSTDDPRAAAAFARALPLLKTILGVGSHG